MINYVLIPKFCELTGYTRKAVQNNQAKGEWLEGIHYVKRGGRILMNLEAFDKWCDGDERHTS